MVLLAQIGQVSFGEYNDLLMYQHVIFFLIINNHLSRFISFRFDIAYWGMKRIRYSIHNSVTLNEKS